MGYDVTELNRMLEGLGFRVTEGGRVLKTGRHVPD